MNFPVQDTIYPHGWEAPWANWSYAWDAALTDDLHASPRYAPTRAFGDVVRRYGTLLRKNARRRRCVDRLAAEPFCAGELEQRRFRCVRRLQRSRCSARATPRAELHARRSARPGRSHAALRRASSSAASIHDSRCAGCEPSAVARLRNALRRSGRLASIRRRIRDRTRVPRTPDVTLLLADDSAYGFIVAINPSGAGARSRPQPRSARSSHGERSGLLPCRAAERESCPVGVNAAGAEARLHRPSLASPPPFSDPDGSRIANAHCSVVFAPFAGARVAELGDGHGNAATSIGLLRDATDPQPAPSSRDYIAPYTHPLAAGTFNRPYECTRIDVLTTERVTCAYDAPDMPDGGATLQANADTERRQQRVDRRRGVPPARSPLDGAARKHLRLRVRSGDTTATSPSRIRPRNSARQTSGRYCAGGAGMSRASTCDARAARRSSPSSLRAGPSNCALGVYAVDTPPRRGGCSTRNSRSSAGKWRNGRRSRLKSGRGNSCGFDSHLPHQIP